MMKCLNRFRSYKHKHDEHSKLIKPNILLKHTKTVES